MSCLIVAFSIYNAERTRSASIAPRQYYDRLPHYNPPSNTVGPNKSIVPSNHPNGVVLKFSWPNSEKRQIEAEMYNTCGGRFGVSEHLVSFEACRSDGVAFSNSIFLPPKIPDVQFSSYRWYPLAMQLKADPSPPDYRALWLTVLAEEGKSLDHCESAWDLAVCLLHAHLGQLCSPFVTLVVLTYNIYWRSAGWLSIMNIGGDGYLHRDVTIGNVLKLNKPVERPTFSTRSLELFKPYHRPTADEDQDVMSSINDYAAAEVTPDEPHVRRKRSRSGDDVGTGGSTPKMPRTDEAMETQEAVALPGAEVMRLEKISHAASHDKFWETLRSSLAHDEYLVNIAIAAERLEMALRKLGVSTMCHAVLGDGDMAAKLQTYFTSDVHAGFISVSSYASVRFLRY